MHQSGIPVIQIVHSHHTGDHLLVVLAQGHMVKSAGDLDDLGAFGCGCDGHGVFERDGGVYGRR